MEQMQRQRLKAAVTEEQQYQQASHQAHMFGDLPSARGRSANVRSSTNLAQSGALCLSTSRPTSRGQNRASSPRPPSRPPADGQVRPISRQLTSRGRQEGSVPHSARAAAPGGPSADMHTPAPPIQARSARSHVRPSPREVRDQQVVEYVLRRKGLGTESLSDRLQAGHILSAAELRELHVLSDAETITNRLQAGHMLTGDDLALLQRAAAACGKDHTGPSQSVGTTQKRSRETLCELQARPPNRPSHRQALAELQQSALLLLSGGLDIGDMRLSDLIELQPAHINPLRNTSAAARSERPRTSSHTSTRTRAGLSAAYGQSSGFPPVLVSRGSCGRSTAVGK